MTDSISCPLCGHRLLLTPGIRGTQVQCTACKKPFTVPPAWDRHAAAAAVFAAATGGGATSDDRQAQAFVVSTDAEGEDESAVAQWPEPAEPIEPEWDKLRFVEADSVAPATPPAPPARSSSSSDLLRPAVRKPATAYRPGLASVQSKKLPVRSAPGDWSAGEILFTKMFALMFAIGVVAAILPFFGYELANRRTGHGLGEYGGYALCILAAIGEFLVLLWRWFDAGKTALRRMLFVLFVLFSPFILLFLWFIVALVYAMIHRM